MSVHLSGYCEKNINNDLFVITVSEGSMYVTWPHVLGQHTMVEKVTVSEADLRAEGTVLGPEPPG